ncbi:DNA translocase FtsK [Bosea sp. (in: a-proteobacteria)]|jgi:S-DNA-T family DNA segregation ATPase FtsK/SpoIIIE|uniref:DNA translocase FtsK n=1 Tax=Bosea sp. (in: a-proteobacteria) TaxID=1871050 RepID=UPI00356AA83D
MRKLSVPFFADGPATGEPATARDDRSIAAAVQPASSFPPGVRYVRTPDKVRQAQMEALRNAAQAAAAAVEPVVSAVSSSSASRVRYGRTPNHLLKQVWVASETIDAPAAIALPSIEPEDDFAQEAGEGAWPEASAAAVAGAIDLPAEEPATPFTFLSDSAFWEFGSEAPRSAAARTERNLPVNEVAAPCAQPHGFAAAMPVSIPATMPTQPGFSWAPAYRVDLRLSAPPRADVAPPAPRLSHPVAVGAVPAAAPVARSGVDVTRATRPELAPRPAPPPRRRIAAPAAAMAEPQRQAGFELPPISILAEPVKQVEAAIPVDILQQNAGVLEGVLEDFNVRGEIVQACPGPVVTLYELEPAPGTKSSRVISLADDIARSMSAISARVAVIPGKNAIGIELPNARRETVFLRELLASQDFESSKHKLALGLGKTIGGEPVIVDLAKMPHLLVAGTTGSGKSVAINTMILSLLYRLTPQQCRLIMVDPKMLELSVYDGIPHLLTPVVTDPKKAVVALKWAVREMEERYKKMSKLSVRNIDGFNARVVEAKAAGEVITRTVQTGFDRHSGEAVYEEEVMDLEPLPYIVVIVDEMADLMMVAGKEIEGTIQRLAQMARAAGIHVVLATQRPSVDVITGTIKANFPTRISFQVTSKIDSRTILGEMGAEQLLGQGDMLYMAGGGRITRVHGPFVSDGEVEKVVAHLKTQGRPQYLDAVTSEEEAAAEDGEDGAVFDKTGMGQAESEDPYDQAVAVVLRDKKASTSYIQRRLQIGYNRAASIMERMENEGIVGPANHAGKRDILVETGRAREDED